MKGSLWIAIAAAWCAGAAAAASLAPLTEREFNAVALRAESQLRQQMKPPLRVEFHRRQGFRLQGAAPAAIVSLLAWPDSGPAHCVLATEQAGQLQTLDALAEDGDQPWSCEGEPALTLADVDGDGEPDLLVLYPYRAPSNDRFMLPLVLRGHAGPLRFVLDAERTRWLRERPPQDLKQMRQALRGRAPG
jgi:hypothetical protein